VISVRYTVLATFRVRHSGSLYSAVACGILSDGSWFVKSLQVLLVREVLCAECASVAICGFGVSPAKVSEVNL